jgi:dTDP-4-dehydrorhamnose 3,5-epimerase
MNFIDGEIKGVVIRELNKHVDNRGFLIETYRKDELPGNLLPEMSYISYTKSGIARGPHEHKNQTDIFCFIGPGSFRVNLWDNRENSATYGNCMEVIGGEKNLITVIVPPGVVHGYKNISKDYGMVLNYPDRLYKGWDKKEEVDEIRHEDKEDEFYLDFINEDRM